MLDLFYKKKNYMETIIKAKSINVFKTYNIITLYENKINIYKSFMTQLKNLNISIENSNTGK